METSTRRHGPPPLERRPLNPRLYDAVRACGIPSWQLALFVGTHGTVLSHLLCAEQVIVSPTNIERLQKIADLVGFDPAAIFLDVGR